jgi:hypothetical protein
MKKLISIATFGCSIVFLPTVALAEPYIVSADGTFLGKLNGDQYDSESICNVYGAYGSPYNNGIFNKYGDYGGTYSRMGAYNPNAQKPPAIIEDNQIIAFITKNPRIKGRYDPDVLLVEVCGR